MKLACLLSGATASICIPHELIAVRAYSKWAERCQAQGYMVHGRDMQDWLEAEEELRQMWSGVSAGDLVEFANILDTRPLKPSHACVKTRAYYKSLRNGPTTREQERQLWLEAEREEIEQLFADAILDWLASRDANALIRQETHQADN